MNFLEEHERAARAVEAAELRKQHFKPRSVGVTNIVLGKTKHFLLEAEKVKKCSVP